MEEQNCSDPIGPIEDDLDILTTWLVYVNFRDSLTLLTSENAVWDVATYIRCVPVVSLQCFTMVLYTDTLKCIAVIC